MPFVALARAGTWLGLQSRTETGSAMLWSPETAPGNFKKFKFQVRPLVTRS